MKHPYREHQHELSGSVLDRVQIDAASWSFEHRERVAGFLADTVRYLGLVRQTPELNRSGTASPGVVEQASLSAGCGSGDRSGNSKGVWI